MYYNNTSLTYASPSNPFLLTFLQEFEPELLSLAPLQYVIFITSCDIVVLRLYNIVVTIGALKMV